MIPSLENITCPEREPEWPESFLVPKGVVQSFVDFLAAPLRMLLLPDRWSSAIGLTSLEDERLRAVLPLLQGRVLDIGAGTNTLINKYRNGVGVDIIDWGGGAMVVEDSSRLPFENGSFDVVTFVACLNHIPDRFGVLQEAFRVLRPDGRVVVTMIGPMIGVIGHKLWWYSEDKHRDIAEGETMGMSSHHVTSLLRDTGYERVIHRTFFYGLNNIFIANKPPLPSTR